MINALQKVNKPVHRLRMALPQTKSATTHSLEELIGLVDFILAISSLLSFRDCHRLHCASTIVVLVLMSFLLCQRLQINSLMSLCSSRCLCLFVCTLSGSRWPSKTRTTVATPQLRIMVTLRSMYWMYCSVSMPVESSNAQP